METIGQLETSYPVEHPEIVGAERFFDRASIEAEAWLLLGMREQLPIIPVERQEHLDNARTALMEALTAAGHLSTVEISGTLTHINDQVLSRLLNGWSDELPEHEQHRRFAEICNELLIQKVHEAITAELLPPDTVVTEISDWPEALRGQQLGYRDVNQKGMVRSTSLLNHGNGQYARVIETISRSNSSWVSTYGLLDACGLHPKRRAADIGALETPLLHTTSDYQDNVIDIMRLLDRYSGQNIRYGDSGLEAMQHPAYRWLRLESARRETEINCFSADLAALEAQLDERLEQGKISPEDRDSMFRGEVDRILSAICTLSPDYAETTYGALAAPYFFEAALREAQGDHEGANELLTRAHVLKQDITFCGLTISIAEAQEAGLKVNSYSDLLEKGKKSWKWKLGTCIVKTCRAKTEVGPCSVCHKCQEVFDSPLLGAFRELAETSKA